MEGKARLRSWQERQMASLVRVLTESGDDPSLLSDLEGSGPVARLEEGFRKLAGTSHVLGVSSGTAAIHTALLAAGIGPGDEVITSSYSWPQTVSPILFTGATPVFADIEPDTFHIDPKAVRSQISGKTKAILAVHLFGHMADMVALEGLAAEAGVFLITDAAHAPGASLMGIPAGAWGDVACFSLGRGKLVSGGEGGIVATNNENLYERALYLTQHPDRVKRWNGLQTGGFLFGLNYRLHPLAALLALADLALLEERLNHRRKIFRAVREGMGSPRELTMQEGQISGCHGAYGIPMTWHSLAGRDVFCTRAQERGLPLRCGPVGLPLHLRVNRRFGPPMLDHSTHHPGTCPVAERRCSEQELWVLGAMDMDALTAAEAREMGTSLALALAETAGTHAETRGSHSGNLCSVEWEHPAGAGLPITTEECFLGAAFPGEATL
ncbi:MAG: DegT/DnrJ/EryC1/StrS family aminotransferase [Syntrophales bacterium]